ncbi:MAG: hypothetical protein IJC18_00860, partial [Clostridia bacterium]|nr:hypothetical protein [Clostridia bacterium]
MIKIVENDSITAMAEYCAGDPFGCRIMATYNTYGLGESFADFWIQTSNSNNSGEIVAVIGRLDDGLTICTKGGSDDEELDLFVREMMGENGALRPARKGEVSDGLVMRLADDVPMPTLGDVEINPPCEDIFTV